MSEGQKQKLGTFVVCIENKIRVATSEDVFHFLQKQTNETYRFICEVINICCAADTVQQSKQPNYLAEGQVPS
eukprot:576869-Pelagomonas_calceolata.AAC.1